MRTRGVSAQAPDADEEVANQGGFERRSAAGGRIIRCRAHFEETFRLRLTSRRGRLRGPLFGGNSCRTRPTRRAHPTRSYSGPEFLPHSSSVTFFPLPCGVPRKLKHPDAAGVVKPVPWDFNSEHQFVQDVVLSFCQLRRSFVDVLPEQFIILSWLVVELTCEELGQHSFRFVNWFVQVRYDRDHELDGILLREIREERFDER